MTAGLLQCVMCCSVMQVCCSVLLCVKILSKYKRPVCDVLQCVAGVLQCDVGVLQYVAVCEDPE